MSLAAVLTGNGAVICKRLQNPFSRVRLINLPDVIQTRNPPLKQENFA